MQHSCAQPLRIDPVTFFIKGPFWRGASLMANVFLSVVSSATLLLSALVGANHLSTFGWLWRGGVMVVPPLAHFIFLKMFIEGKEPHYAADRFRWILRLRLSVDKAWPRWFPVLPGLAPESEVHAYALACPPPRGVQSRYYVLRRNLQLQSGNAMLRLLDEGRGNS